MMTRIKKLSLLPALMAGLGWTLADPLAAQTLTNLYDFTALSAPVGGANNDGANPYAGLILSSNMLFGTAVFGGDSGDGSIFAVNTNGTGFTNLYSFTATTGSFPAPQTNSDGANPYGELILLGDTLYGTAQIGGAAGNGTIFAIHSDGTGFTNLHSFAAGAHNREGQVANTDGAFPQAGLVLSGNTLFGTAFAGGTNGNGAVFAINTNGSGFTNLHSFPANLNFGPNSDGASPIAGLLLSGNTLYGTAEYGGLAGNGSIFAIQTNGSGFTNLYSFSQTSAPNYTNSDGANPEAALTLSGKSLYGTSFSAGRFGYGTIFALPTNGVGFASLHSFSTPVLTAGGASTNSDGAEPVAGLVLSGKTLYGATSQGGLSGNGVVFAVNTSGAAFTNLYSFTASSQISPYTNSDGANPQAGLILSGNTLYGAAYNDGASGYGSIFGLSLAPVAGGGPELTIARAGTNVILTWPGTDTGFVLQSTTNLFGGPIWKPVLPAAVLTDGQNTVTNLISGKTQFYRLSQM